MRRDVGDYVSYSKRGGFDFDNTYNRPLVCEKCGGIMEFRGVGEYRCEKCGFVDYDDYGKTRNYIESHPGANAGEVELRTGVTQKSIRMMLKENRLEITADSTVFLSCENCGVKIRGGRLCPKCEKEYHERFEAEMRMAKKGNISGGFASNNKIGEDGAKRFSRK